MDVLFSPNPHLTASRSDRADRHHRHRASKIFLNPSCCTASELSPRHGDVRPGIPHTVKIGRLSEHSWPPPTLVRQILRILWGGCCGWFHFLCFFLGLRLCDTRRGAHPRMLFFHLYFFKRYLVLPPMICFTLIHQISAVQFVA